MHASCTDGWLAGCLAALAVWAGWLAGWMGGWMVGCVCVCVRMYDFWNLFSTASLHYSLCTDQVAASALQSPSLH